MCSTEYNYDYDDYIPTCYSDPYAVGEVTTDDVNAVIYKYGKDGFKEPNRNLEGQMPVYKTGTPVDDYSQSVANKGDNATSIR
jgi:hypothetical protein